MSKRATDAEFRNFLSELHDNMYQTLATEPRRPGVTSTLEYISISGEHYFPEKKDLMALDGKAVAFFNSAAVFLSRTLPEDAAKSLPAKMSPQVENSLVASGLTNIAQLVQLHRR